MAMKIPMTTIQSMLKDGTRTYQGVDDAVISNIQAVKQFAKITKSSFGCNGMKKLVVNRNAKVFITNDSATMVNELEIRHPAAKVISMASKMQEEEMGDGSNAVILFAAALLSNAEDLINMGMPACDIVEGYKLAAKKLDEILPSLVCFELTDVFDMKQVLPIITTAIGSKQYSERAMLANLVCEACFSSKSRKEQDFNVDNIRTVKIPGSSIENSQFYQGLVFTLQCQGTVRHVTSAKIVVYTVAFDLMHTETKGTVLLNTALELSSFTKGEEAQLSQFVESLKKAGVNVVVTSDKASDQAIDFANRHGIMVIRMSSKFDILRLCRATKARPLPLLKVPDNEEIGHCQNVYSTEIGDTNVVVFNEEREERCLSTIVIRGSSQSLLDDVERAVDDAVNCYKAIVRLPRLLPGAGATECQLYHQILQFAKTHSDLKQYAITKYAEACLIIPKAIAENNGFSASDMISILEEKHAAASAANTRCYMGVDVESDTPQCVDTLAAGILDSLYCKSRIFQLATISACTILGVDQIVMAKVAGGPRMEGHQKALDDD